MLKIELITSVDCQTVVSHFVKSLMSVNRPWKRIGCSRLRWRISRYFVLGIDTLAMLILRTNPGRNLSGFRIPGGWLVPVSVWPGTCYKLTLNFVRPTQNRNKNTILTYFRVNLSFQISLYPVWPAPNSSETQAARCSTLTTIDTGSLQTTTWETLPNSVQLNAGQTDTKTAAFPP